MSIKGHYKVQRAPNSLLTLKASVNRQSCAEKTCRSYGFGPDFEVTLLTTSLSLNKGASTSANSGRHHSSGRACHDLQKTPVSSGGRTANMSAFSNQTFDNQQIDSATQFTGSFNTEILYYDVMPRHRLLVVDMERQTFRQRHGKIP